jgi:hypothetical protein
MRKNQKIKWLAVIPHGDYVKTEKNIRKYKDLLKVAVAPYIGTYEFSPSETAYRQGAPAKFDGAVVDNKGWNYTHKVDGDNVVLHNYFEWIACNSFLKKSGCKAKGVWLVGDTLVISGAYWADSGNLLEHGEIPTKNSISVRNNTAAVLNFKYSK